MRQRGRERRHAIHRPRPWGFAVVEHQDEAVGYFTLKDPLRRPGYLSRPRLLRQTADAIDALGEVIVHSIVLHEELTDWKWIVEHVSFTVVYYSRPDPPGGSNERQHQGAATDSAEAKPIPSFRYSGDHIHPDMAEDRSNHSFCLQNPRNEADSGSVSKLLRRTADAVDHLPGVEIDNLVLHTEVTPAGRLPTVAVYYSRPTPDDWESRAEWARLMDQNRMLFLAEMKERRTANKKRKRKH